jgi:hypothetical protein
VQLTTCHGSWRSPALAHSRKDINESTAWFKWTNHIPRIFSATPGEGMELVAMLIPRLLDAASESHSTARTTPPRSPRASARPSTSRTRCAFWAALSSTFRTAAVKTPSWTRTCPVDPTLDDFPAARRRAHLRFRGQGARRGIVSSRPPDGSRRGRR